MLGIRALVAPLALLVMAAAPAAAHVMSFSSGDLAVRADRARYELRIPSYEVAHIRGGAEAALFAHIRFAGGGGPARLVSRSCRTDGEAFACTADYLFPGPVDRLDVECDFHAVTVPNHVHLLRAERDGKRDQALFDFSFPKATLRFDPPGAFETAATEAFAGARRALTLAVLLFLAALVVAARSRRELAALAAAFLVGQWVSATIVPVTTWQPPARFVEAATALTIAYLAVEVLLLPGAGARWLVAGVLGAFHGLYFALLLRTSDYGAGWVMTGATAAEIAILGVLAWLFSRVGRAAARFRPVQVSASVLLLAGMGWFFLRMAG
jgi:hypothetical protein